MRLTLCLVLLSLVVSGAGCTGTSLTGFRDPAFKDASYSDVVVMARSGNLIQDQMAEGYFVRSLSSRRVSVRPSTDFFPPTRETTQSEVIKKLNEEGVGALITVHLERRWNVTANEKGTSYTRPRATYTVQLIDLKSGSIAWTASSDFAGDIMAGEREIMSSLASKTAETLVKEGIVRPAETKAGR
jgi:hypothetical protein